MQVFVFQRFESSFHRFRGALIFIYKRHLIRSSRIYLVDGTAAETAKRAPHAKEERNNSWKCGLQESPARVESFLSAPAPHPQNLNPPCTRTSLRNIARSHPHTFNPCPLRRPSQPAPAPHFFGLKPAPVRILLKTHYYGTFLLQQSREKCAFNFNKSCNKKLHLCTYILNDSDLPKRFICI